MSLLFWGLLTLMLVAAIAVVWLPLRNGKPLLNLPPVFLAVLIPLLAMGLYAYVGSPNVDLNDKAMPHQSQRLSASTSSGQTDNAVGSVGSLLDGLKERLENEPDDADGWILLARSYEHLDQPADASAAYAKAKALGNTDSALESSLSGTASPVAQTPTASGPALRGRVALSPEAVSRIESGDTVFIFAKESLEHRMPVVALRKSANDLPIQFELTDAQAMVPGKSLADYEQLVVTARISRSGLATDTVDGLEANSAPVSPLAEDELHLLIVGTNE